MPQASIRTLLLLISRRQVAIVATRTGGLHEDFGEQKPSTVDLAPFRKVPSAYLGHSVGLRPSARPSSGFGRLAPSRIHLNSIRFAHVHYIGAGGEELYKTGACGVPASGLGISGGDQPKLGQQVSANVTTSWAAIAWFERARAERIIVSSCHVAVLLPDQSEPVLLVCTIHADPAGGHTGRSIRGASVCASARLNGMSAIPASMDKVVVIFMGRPSLSHLSYPEGFKARTLLYVALQCLITGRSPEDGKQEMICRTNQISGRLDNLSGR